MKIMKQKNWPWLGALIDSVYTSTPIVNMIQFLSVIAILYTSTRPWLVAWIPWMKLHWFYLIFVLASALLVVFVYLFIVRSVWAFRGKQIFGEDATKAIRQVIREELKNWKKEEE